MGQSVSQQLGSGSLGYGVDPDYLRSQILQQREKQFAAIQNPFQQAAARLGTILGGGIANLAQDRGFFEVNDPLLNKVTQIQGIYNQVASQVDPATDPARFFSELQKAYSDAGMGQQALLAAQEAQKAKGSALDLQIKETTALEKNPELITGRIEDALKSGNEAEAMRLANLKTRLDQDRELTLEGKRVGILKDKAYINYQNSLAEGGKYSIQPVNKDDPTQGFYRVNQKTGDITVVPLPKELADRYTAPKAGDNKGKPEGKLDKNKYIVGGNTNVPSSSAASTMSSLDGIAIDTGDATAASVATPVQTTWSGVPINPKPVTNTSALTPMQERDFAIQRAFPNAVVSMLTEQQKAVLAQQLGL